MQNDAARLDIYARISKCRSQGELDAIEDEIEDRFGELGRSPVSAVSHLIAGRWASSALTLIHMR
jgi:transcription-repair coupling factor (superfamily II helicase)